MPNYGVHPDNCRCDGTGLIPGEHKAQPCPGPKDDLEKLHDGREKTLTFRESDFIDLIDNAFRAGWTRGVNRLKEQLIPPESISDAEKSRLIRIAREGAKEIDV